MYLEKYIEHPRHIEVQILADDQGNVVHLWERDCTMQRRHQKVIEESPAPNLGPETGGRFARRPYGWSRRPNYANAGTVEFIVDRQGKFYFIEVNARIQVEHPVSEMVTGIDLIKSQIRVALGEPLPFRQEEIFEAARRSSAASMPKIRTGIPAVTRQDQQDDRSRRLRRARRFARPRRL